MGCMVSLFQTVKKKVGSWAHDRNIFQHRWQWRRSKHVRFFHDGPELLDLFLNTLAHRVNCGCYFACVGSESKPVLAYRTIHTSVVIGSSTLTEFCLQVKTLRMSTNKDAIVSLPRRFTRHLKRSGSMWRSSCSQDSGHGVGRGGEVRK